MIINLSCSLILSIIVAIVSCVTSGGTLAGIFNPVQLAVTAAFVVPVLLAGGYLGSFSTIFRNRRHVETLSLSGLKSSAKAVELAIKGVIAFGVFTGTFAAVMFEYSWISGSLYDAGPNLAGCFLGLYYSFLVSLILLPVWSSLNRKVILFMGRESENPAEVQMTASEIIVSAVKPVICIILVTVLFYVNKLGSINDDGYDIMGFFDWIYGGLMLCQLAVVITISGNWKNLGIGLLAAFTGRKLSVTRRKLCGNAMMTGAVTAVLTGLTLMITGFMSILNNLEDISALPANVNVSALPFFYGIILAFIFMIVKARLEKENER